VRWIRRPRAAGCGLIALALVIGLIAIADHTNKRARMNHAELLEWYCAHQGTRCGGPSSSAIERHWNERQTAYEILVSVLAAAGLALIASPWISGKQPS